MLRLPFVYRHVPNSQPEPVIADTSPSDSIPLTETEMYSRAGSLGNMQALSVLGPETAQQIEALARQRGFTVPDEEDGSVSDYTAQLNTDDEFEGEDADRDTAQEQARINAMMINRIFLVLVIAFVLAAIAIGVVVLVLGTAPTSSSTKYRPKVLYNDLALQYPYEYWMEVHTGHLTTRSLLNLTLPGAHNAGNTLLLNQNRMYQPESQWDDFKDYIAANKGADSVSKVTESQFHSANLRWNVNHHVGFKEQLKGGIRYFHLKLCYLGSQSQTQPDASADVEEGEVREGQMESARKRRVEGSEDWESEEQPDAEKKQTGGTNSWYGTLDTSQIYHCHRGYTGMPLVDMFDILGEFLLSHPKEAVVLGFNDLSGFDASQEENLAKFISQRFYEVLVRDWSRMTRTSLHVLYQTDERLGVFYGPQLETYPHGIIPSSGHLQESWDKDIGSSGDLEAYSEWVAEDLGKYASQHSHFYVTQNNPNNNVNATFDAVYDRITGETTYHKSARSEEADDQNPNSTLIGFSYVNPNSGLPYASLYEWEYEYMRNLPTFMFRELSQHDHIMVNAISTDFMHAARTVELCLYLMRIHS